MTTEELKSLQEAVGTQTAAKIATELTAFETKAKAIAEAAVKEGGATKEQFEEYQTATKTALAAMEAIAIKQGTTITDLHSKMTQGVIGNKSIAETLKENEDELRQQYSQGSGTKTFMVSQKADGTFAMRPFDPAVKAVGITGTIDGLSGAGSTSSVTSALDASTLLRLGGAANIYGQYRNDQWLFDLVNTVPAGWDTPMAMWWEEKAVQGAPADVGEGASKPLVQYSYELESKPYKKAAQLITFTDEFSLDFARLQSDIMGKGRTDVLNLINTNILTDLTAAATAYSTGATFSGGAGLITNVNDFDVIAAMAAQVDNATFGSQNASGSMANTAIMSTFKKYRMGIEKSTQGEYLNRPDVLSGISFIGNPAVGADNVIVGDLKQMNLILRGGFLVKIGYNGTNFAENKFSVVMEQYYFDYIPAVRRPAIVKGPTFAAVKTAIS